MTEIALGARAGVRNSGGAISLIWPLSNRWTIMLAVFLTLLALGFVGLRVKRLNLGYEISRNRQSLQALEEVSRKTLAETEALKNPRRIERLARNKLGLVYPSSNQLVIMGKTGRNNRR